jgi:murein DD-endopeptidase MepM/ murein hydrolase activator NlpD
MDGTMWAKRAIVLSCLSFVGVASGNALAGRVEGALARSPSESLDPASGSGKAALARELDALGPALAATHGKVIRQARAWYRRQRAGLLPVGGGVDAILRHAAALERTRRGLIAELNKERVLRKKVADITAALQASDRDREALAAQRAAEVVAHAAEEEERDREEAFRQAFESSPQGAEIRTQGGYLRVLPADDGEPAAPRASGFSRAKGHLLFPVTGAGDVRGVRLEGAEGPGVEIKATPGSVIRAVYAARVAFADRYGPYGRMVILDHGEHYYTVSGYLGSIDVRIGDEVEAGQRLGTPSDDGRGPRAYFELRRGTQTLAPGPWLGIRVGDGS